MLNLYPRKECKDLLVEGDDKENLRKDRENEMDPGEVRTWKGREEPSSSPWNRECKQCNIWDIAESVRRKWGSGWE